MFIESQKRKLDNDKRELMKAQDALSPRDNQVTISISYSENLEF